MLHDDPRKPPKQYASPDQIRYARDLRGHLTNAEVHLWSHLRRRQLGGFKFRRQHPVDRYVADFACVERRIVVEIDGSSHFDRGVYDEARDRVMESLGWTVLRYVDDDVLQHVDAVLSDILAHCQAPS